MAEEDASWIFTKAIDLYLEEKAKNIFEYVDPLSVPKDDPRCTIFKTVSNYYETESSTWTASKIATPEGFPNLVYKPIVTRSLF